MWTYWELDPTTTNTHVFGVRSKGVVCLGSDAEDSDQHIRAWIRWDACMFVKDEREIPYHLCNLDDEIGRWQEFKTIAHDYFGGEFGIGGLSEDAVKQYVAAHTR